MRFHPAIIVVAALLGGCASSGPLGSETLAAGARPGTARVVIYRSNMPIALAIQPDYVIDGKVIAGSQPNGFVVCDLPPGRHEVAVANSAISEDMFGTGSERVILQLRAGSTTYLYAEPQWALVSIPKVTLKAVGESQGRADTASLHRINGACGAA